jgi:hypothetical protein
MGDVLSLASGTSTGGYGNVGHTRAIGDGDRHWHTPTEHQLRSRRVRVAATRAGHPTDGTDGTDGKATAHATPGGIRSGFVESSSDGVPNA